MKKFLLGFIVALTAISLFSDTATIDGIDKSARAAVIKDVKFRQRYPWNNKVDIDYTIVREMNGVIVSFIVKDNDAGKTYTHLSFDKEPPITEGTHRITWDADADGISITSTNVVVGADFAYPLYIVVDLSGGTSATSYPVTTLSDVPAGGWTDEYKTTKLVLRKITAGKMPRTDVDITLTKDYYVGVFEVTQRQWELVMGSNPSYFDGNTLPVEFVSYNKIRGNSNGSQWPASNAVDATSFMGKLRAKTGIDFDLPTEAQWEYACRAGSSGDWGLLADGTMGTIDQMGWYDDNSSDKTHAVGTKTPNAWGLYDMHGNVWECCLDWYSSSGYSGTDPVGATAGSVRVFRGGSWYTNDGYCRSSLRNKTGPNSRDPVYGLRVAVPAVTGIARIYSVTFDANGGEGTMPSQTFTYGVEQELSANAFTREGYTFAGWATSEDGEVAYTVRQSISVSTPMTLYAVWEANTYAVSFSANGGEGTMASQIYTYGVEQALSANAFTREGYTFAGWATSADGEVAYTAGQRISITAPMTLYAVWHPKTYIVIDLSGGTSAASYPVTTLSDVPAGGWTDEYKTTKLVLRKITAGKMPRTDVDITLTKDYYVGIFELTQKQWELVMGSYPSNFDGDTLPVEYVSYNDIRGTSKGSQWPASNAVDASSFMGKLRAKTGIDFDLPTEAQWEYACRAGSSGDWGLLADGSMGTLDAMGWYGDNSSSKTHAVGTKTQNAWGLYDMHGNVWEWCLDWDSSSGYSGSDPVGGTSGDCRVLHSGSWYYKDAYFCESSYRNSNNPDVRLNSYGLRVAAPAGIDITQTYEVTFNANGGEGTMSAQTFTQGVEQELSANAFTREGYTFVGWATSADGAIAYAAGQSISISAPMTLYAVWYPAGTYIVVDLSGGTSATSYPVTTLLDVPDGGWTDDYKTTKLVLRKITAGKMPRTDVDITLTKDYYVGVFEVTQKQWELVMGSNPSYFDGDTSPVEMVRYNNIRGTSKGSQWPASNAVDASSFMGKLRVKTGIDFDLPTEAQWEYACRAGSQGYWGLLADGTMGTLGAMGWYYYNSSEKTYTVGTKTPNAWGLYDMHGNVWEWCLDWYGDVYSGTDPVGANSAYNRVSRGGSWCWNDVACRSSIRNDYGPGYGHYDLGLRVAAPAVTGIAQTYSVNFNANGGEGTMPSQTFTYGVEQALSANAFTREGYTFAGWATSADGVVAYTACQSISVTTSMTLYAVWEANTYAVSFSANGGEGTMSSQTFTYGVEQALSANAFTRKGYTFAGWATSADGVVAYTASQSISISAPQTLYAIWEANTYAVSFSANGGEGTMPAQTFTHGVEQALSANAFTRKGYTFAGWATSADGEVAYIARQSISVSTSMTLYAVWEANTYAVSFSANGGEGTMASQTFTHGVEQALSANAFTREGYTFAGWATSADGAVAYKAGESISVTALMTLYAVWEANTYAVSFSANGGEGTMSSQTFTHGVAQAIKANAFTREEHTFAGWATSADGTVAYTAGQSISITAPMTLYAVWYPASTYIVVDLSGGTSAANYPVTNLSDVPAGGWSDEYKTTKLVLRRITAGKMPRTDVDITLTKDYYVGVFEVTQKQWELVMGTNPSKWDGDTLPVETVSYYDIRGTSNGSQWPASNAVDAISFMGKLRAKTGIDFDLPTEAQWEYACRAGSTGDWGLLANGTMGTLGAMGWYDSNSSFKTHAVGTKKPNAWGLYDMHGNVFEWCLDRYSISDYSGSDPVGGTWGSSRVLHGGSWIDVDVCCGSSSRIDGSPDYNRYGVYGFRVAAPAGL